MKIRFLILMALMFMVPNVARADNELFAKANESYKAGDYQKAFERYSELAKELPRAEVYYDLGNSAFKLNHIGEAILNFERAKQLAPRNEDILHNLQFVQSMMEYRVEDKRSWFEKLTDKTLEHFTFKECAAILILAYFVFIFPVSMSLFWKKSVTLNSFGVLILTLVVLASALTGMKFYELHFQKKGVVTQSKVEARFGPSEDDRLAFTVGEGITVVVDDENADWYRVKLDNQASGWVPKKGIELV